MKSIRRQRDPFPPRRLAACKVPGTHPGLRDEGQECHIVGVRVLKTQSSYVSKPETAEVILQQIVYYFEKLIPLKKITWMY